MHKIVIALLKLQKNHKKWFLLLFKFYKLKQENLNHRVFKNLPKDTRVEEQDPRCESKFVT